MITFKDLTVDTDRKTCYIEDKEILLTKTEYNLLLFLVSNKNKILTRKELAKSVWDAPVSNRAVDTTVIKVKKKAQRPRKELNNQNWVWIRFTRIIWNT